MAIEILIRFSSRLDFIEFLTRSAAPSHVFEDGAKKHGSGSTPACGRQAEPSDLSSVEENPRPLGRGVEGLTFLLKRYNNCANFSII
jgi:hypothetical protein